MYNLYNSNDVLNTVVCSSLCNNVDFFSSKGNNFHIFHQNIRSMRANFDCFCANFRALCLPQIIVLSEIWIEDCELTSYNIRDYSLHANCNNSYRAGGVAAFVHNDIICSSEKLNFQTADCLLLKMRVLNTSMYVLCIYKFIFSDNENFVSELRQFINSTRYYNFFR